MKLHGRLNGTWLALPLAATVAVTACAPQATQQANRTTDVPAAVEQVQQAQQLPVGTFAGMIATFEDGQFKPVVGATVKVEGQDGTAMTDVDGRYVFNGLKPGDYKVVVTKDGFAQGEQQVNLSPVAGTPRVNVAMNKPGYALKQAAITPFNLTVTGVVTDPRGAALPNASVRIATTAGTGTNQTVLSNANGFYTVTINNMSASPISPGYVQVTAFGTSPGGVKLEVDEVWAKPVTSASLVVNARCEAFTVPRNMTYPAGTFTPMGALNATIEVENISTRADEFYLLLSGNTATTASGTYQFAVLPESITNTPAAGAVPQKANIKFRVPFAFPADASTYTVSIVPFGQGAAAYTGPGNFVVQYTQTDFSNDVDFTTHDIADANEPPTIPANVNTGKFVAGEDAVYTLNLTNDNTNVSQDLKVKGRVSTGATIRGVKLTTTMEGAPDTVVSASVAPANITQPDGNGDWSVTGLSLPQATGFGTGKAKIEVTFASSTATVGGNNFAVSNVAVEMPSAGHVDQSGPAAAVTNSPFNVRTVARDVLTLVSKTIDDGAVANDGYAEVTLVVDPGAASNAAGVYRIVDQTESNKTTPPRKATLLGSVAVPTQPNTVGLSNADVLEFIIDGVTATPKAVNLTNASTWTLETLCQIINLSVPEVTASRDAGTNKIKIERKVAGSSKSVAIHTTTTQNVKDRLGFTAANSTDSGSDGLEARFAALAGAPDTPVVTQAAGATWDFVTGSSSSVHNNDGTLTTTFAIQPTNGAAVATVNGLITIKYVIQLQGMPAAGSNAANLLLGKSATAAAVATGARISALNLVAPFTVIDRELNVTAGTNTMKADPDSTPTATAQM